MMIIITQDDVIGIEWEAKLPGLNTYCSWGMPKFNKQCWAKLNQDYYSLSKPQLNALDFFIKLRSNYLHHNYHENREFFYWRKINRYQLKDILSAKSITVSSNTTFLGYVFDIYMMLFYFIEKEVLHLQ